jgi:acyl carrier protein
MEISRSQIENELRDILLKIIDVPSEELTPDAHFFQDLGIDSIKAIEIIVAIDKHFKVSLNDDIGQVTTLAEATEIIFNILEKR